MRLFRSRRATVRIDPARVAPTDATHPVGTGAAGRPWSLWSDGFGAFATRALQILIVVAIAAAAFVGMRQLTVVIIPLIIALIIASAFAPSMAWMRRRGVPSLLATLLTFFAALGFLALLSWLITVAVRSQWDELSSQAQQGFDDIVAWSATLPISIDQPQIDQWISDITDFLTSAQFGTGAIAGVSAVATFFTGLVLMIVMLFFFLKDGPQMWRFLLRPFNEQRYERAVRIGDKVIDTLGSYVRGTATIAAVDATGILIGLLILQVPLAVPLAVIVFVLAFIPMVGATIAGILAALVALVANGWVSAVLVVGVIVLVQQLEGNLLQPVVMGRSMKLHAFVVFVALTAGTVLGGVLGAVIAVPITAVAWGVVQVWDGPSTPAAWARRKDRDSDAAPA
ncbi:AI-2E family transporter [Microbacterium sp.]|uniref:AI-2E family transporter n=1 Tax=Microbacterium sp. TaxID=51671 RepID=UPI003A8B3DD4